MSILRRLVPWLAAALVAAALAAPATGAQADAGPIEPRIAAKVSGATPFVRIVTVRLTDAGAPDQPVDGATVTAVGTMVAPDHRMATRPAPLEEVRPGLYRGRISFQMGGTDWTVRIRVTGAGIVPTTARLVTYVDPDGLTPPAPASETTPDDAAAVGAPAPAPTPTPTVEAPDLAPETAAPAAPATPGSTGAAGETAGAETASAAGPAAARPDATVTGRDALTIVLLWLHGLAAAGWLLGVVVTAVALGVGPGVLQPGVRPGLARWYRRRGVWLHWALAVVVVATGVHNVLGVAPLDLGSRSDVPYGGLYVGLLAAKLACFAALLVTATLLTRRVLRRPAPIVSGRPLRQLAASLGPAGLVYLALVPIVVGLVVALRYVHVLAEAATAAAR